MHGFSHAVRSLHRIAQQAVLLPAADKAATHATSLVVKGTCMHELMSVRYLWRRLVCAKLLGIFGKH
jgi:hypothetical protein